MKTIENNSVLLINPWIYDFAAYDFWVKPLGLLYLARYLEMHGYACTLIDCVHRDDAHTQQSGNYNTGKFFSEIIDKPALLKHIPRHYRRYGISPDELRTRLHGITQKPLAIFFTCIMTYWYPGLRDAVAIIKELFPDTPIVVSGIYAKLCSAHATQTINADYIFTDNAEAQALSLLDELSHVSRPAVPFDIRTIDRPAYHLYDTLSSASMTTSLGCPLRCHYCASSILQSSFVERSAAHIIEELSYYIDHFSITDIAFYDDALLLNPEHRIVPVLHECVRRNYTLHFHTPNGLHVREITDELAHILFAAGFKTLRLSFESTNAQRQKDSSWKVTNDDFVRAIAALKRAGFTNKHIGIYVMIGLPDQTLEEIEASVQFVHEHGVKVTIVQYSPIPGTPYGDICADADPLVHNNSVFPLTPSSRGYQYYQKIKDLIRGLNASLNS